jgi:hypothetical protein
MGSTNILSLSSNLCLTKCMIPSMNMSTESSHGRNAFISFIYTYCILYWSNCLWTKSRTIESTIWNEAMLARWAINKGAKAGYLSGLNVVNNETETLRVWYLFYRDLMTPLWVRQYSVKRLITYLDDIQIIQVSY